MYDFCSFILLYIFTIICDFIYSRYIPVENVPIDNEFVPLWNSLIWWTLCVCVCVLLGVSYIFVSQIKPLKAEVVSQDRGQETHGPAFVC